MEDVLEKIFESENEVNLYGTDWNPSEESTDDSGTGNHLGLGCCGILTYFLLFGSIELAARSSRGVHHCLWFTESKLLLNLGFHGDRQYSPNISPIYT